MHLFNPTVSLNKNVTTREAFCSTLIVFVHYSTIGGIRISYSPLSFLLLLLVPLLVLLLIVEAT